ncbi:MAG: sugar ABC transporter ATP-binding protein [Oscillospiraceae bacterium]|nr:sugar ABC transporter ATP-binding protein [Oscillospiraceae bacterium]
MSEDIILQMSDIEMNFPGVRALREVDFTLRKGEVHCIMGENGAGKSTLIKCLTGVYQMDSGTILFDGNKIRPQSVSESMKLGISSVYQEVNLCPNLTVSENLFIGRQPMKAGALVDWPKMNRLSQKALERFNLNVNVTRNLDSYSVAVQQMVAIVRAVDVSAKVLIFDEPTSSLDKDEVERLFDVIRKLKSEGMAIIFITHFLDQVYQISDRITVLRNGELVGEYLTEDLPRIDLVTKMVGRDFDQITSLQKVALAEGRDVVIEASDISVDASISHMDLTLREGEILGFAGLLGSGRSETARALFGIDKISSGAISIKGGAVHLKSPITAIKNKIAFCPEDRKRDGIIADLTVRENIILALQGRMGMFQYISRKKQNEIANKYIELLGIATPDAEKKIGELSGGNQQKVILARWLATEPDALILDEPTRGIDVGAKAEIMKLTLELCEKGMAVAFISSELEEVVKLSNNIIVMRDRKKVAEIKGKDIDQDRILEAIAGGDKEWQS